MAPPTGFVEGAERGVAAVGPPPTLRFSTGVENWLREF
jgi:hypothetical protein